jgi:hypothetical protein
VIEASGEDADRRPIATALAERPDHQGVVALWTVPLRGRGSCSPPRCAVVALDEITPAYLGAIGAHGEAGATP